MTAIMGWASVLAYLAIGATYALVLLRRWRSTPELTADRFDHAVNVGAALLAVVIWPLVIAFRAAGRLIAGTLDYLIRRTR